MDPAPLIFLVFIALIFLLGILSIFLANFVKISRILFFLAIGIILSLMGLFDLSPIFIAAISILALAMIVFDTSSRFKHRIKDNLSFEAFKLTIIILVLNIIFLSIALFFLYSSSMNLWFVVILSFLMLGTDITSLTIAMKKLDTRLIDFLDIESAINTFFVILTPFIALSLTADYSHGLLSSVYPMLLNIILSIGVGVVLGLIFFRFLYTKYSETLSPIIILSSILLAYIIAENIGGNGVLAIVVIGLFFGAFYLKEKEKLIEFSTLFTGSLEILVFILAGIIVKVPLTLDFILISIVLFMILVMLRVVAVFTSLGGIFDAKEKIFLALNAEKGLEVGVIILALSAMKISYFEPILQLSVAFMIYSIILSFFVARIFGSLPTKKPKPSKKRKVKKK